MTAWKGALLVLLALAPTAAVGAEGGDARRGEQLYERLCVACHSVEADRIGPRHRGVVGRAAGAVPDYSYSRALKESGLVWDRANLDRWLTNPEALVPGQKMGFRVAKPEDRADLIAFLATLSP